MIQWGVLTLRIVDALEQHGPMTRTELCAHLGVDRMTASSVVSRLSKPTKRPHGPKRVYICDWRDDAEGERRYLRAVYAVGDLPDKRKPSARERTLAAKRRYWAARKVRLASQVLCFSATIEVSVAEKTPRFLADTGVKPR